MQAKQVGLSAGPTPGEFAVGLGEVARVVLRGRRSGGRVQGRDTQHQRTPDPPGTCLFSKIVVAVEVVVFMVGRSGQGSGNVSCASEVCVERGCRVTRDIGAVVAGEGVGVWSSTVIDVGIAIV